MKCLRRFVPLDADPKTIHGDNSLDFTKVVMIKTGIMQYLGFVDPKQTANGIAERQHAE